MALNGIQWTGANNRYIAELERTVEELRRQIAILQSQTNARSR